MAIKDKKAQVAIFIIIAILIVVSVIIALWFFGRNTAELPKSLNPDQFIDKCVRDAVEPSVEAVLAGGGRVEPDFYKQYNGDPYNYLCYQKNYYLACINHYPQLKAIVEEEIRADSDQRVRDCFNSLKQELESKGFSVVEEELEYNIKLVPKIVKININKKFNIFRGETAQSFESFNAELMSPLYELVMVARDIVNQESQYCNFEYNGFMLLYPEFDIKRISYEEELIYKIMERRSGKVFRFAIRGCAFPPGF